MSKQKEKRITLQVPVTQKTAALLEESAELAGNSQTFLASWAIGVAVEDPSEVGTWIGKMLKSGIKAESADSETGLKETRVRVQLKEKSYQKLCHASVPLGIKPVKLASILIAAVLPNTRLTQRFLGTAVCSALRRVINGKDDLYFEHLMKDEKPSEDGELASDAA